MAKWSFSKKHLPSEINGGNQYKIKDRLVLEQLNAITENSFYASEKVDTVISDAQDVVNQGKTEIENTTSQGKNELNSIVDDAEDLVAKANTSINAVVGTANEALFTVQQVVASKGYYGSNPNLLINGDFRVNQRGEPSYSGNQYTVDRWSTVQSSTTVEPIDKGVRVSLSKQYAKFRQYIEDVGSLKGKRVTLSAKISNLNNLRNNLQLQLYQLSDTNVVDETIRVVINGNGIVQVSGVVGDNITKLAVEFYTWSDNTETTSFDVEWVKLEIGSVATAFSPRTYAEELAMCQRYYLKLMNGASVYNGFIFTETNARISVPVPTTMRLRTPTAEFNVGDISQCKIYSNGTQVTPTALVYAGFVDSDQFVINATIPNATPNHTCAMRLLGSASLDAEIY